MCFKKITHGNSLKEAVFINAVFTNSKPKGGFYCCLFLFVLTTTFVNMKCNTYRKVQHAGQPICFSSLLHPALSQRLRVHSPPGFHRVLLLGASEEVQVRRGLRPGYLFPRFSPARQPQAYLSSFHRVPPSSNLSLLRSSWA